MKSGKTSGKKAPSPKGGKKASAPAGKKSSLPATKEEKAHAPVGNKSKLFNELVSKINRDIVGKEADRGPVIMMANAANCSYLLRRPTGVLSTDIGLAGGFPASAPSVIVGPEGIGKDHLLWRTCGETQRIYGDDFAMAVYMTEFKPDKGQMRAAGLKVAYTPEEVAELERSRAMIGLPPLTDEEKADLYDQIGQIAIISGVSAEDGFDALCGFLEANLCQIIAVNSIGFLQTNAKEETESFTQFAQQSSEAMLLSKVAPKFSMLMNRLGTLNETAILLINQVRSKQDGTRVRGRPVMEKDKYQPAAGAKALRHGMAIELFLHRGSAIYNESEKTYLGREVNWELSKGKLGTHDGIRGKYTYYYDGGIDIESDLMAVAMQYDVLELGGSIYTFRPPQGFKGDLGFTVKGKERVIYTLRNNPEVKAAIREACLRAAGVNYRYR